MSTAVAACRPRTAKAAAATTASTMSHTHQRFHSGRRRRSAGPALRSIASRDSEAEDEELLAG